jgi:Protein of unknown function DUF262/Protein of unknown function (DUF1524)
MKAEERTISNILTEQICYEIPPYQRPYSWEQENVQQLLEDVWEAYEAGDSEYFIGSLITIEKERDRRYDVVDGQQRLTTLNLIFARLRDCISDEAVKADLGKRILPRNVYTGEAETPRLLLRKKDQAFFRKHVLEAQPVTAKDRGCLEIPQRHLVENGETVDAFCLDKSQQVLKLFANYVLTKVYVVFVTTYSWHSAYRLFNVLNARGIPLSNADLIKNTLFGQLGAQTNRSNELEERWLELEEELGIERLDAFFGHHRTAVTAAKARGSLHEEIEPLVRAQEGGPFPFLDKVVASAENYMRIVEGEFKDATTLRALRALRRVEYDEWIPPLLAFLNNPVKQFPEAEFVSLLEKVTMQNWVRRLGRTARLTVYYQLISAIRDGKAADEVREIFRKNAQNGEFLHLLGGELYGKPFDAAVLLRLEEAEQDESVTKSYSGRLTIEHVLPQTLKDDYWKGRFTEEQHGIWLHRLGNLALLCGHKNYKAQYYDFGRKKKIYSDRNKKVSFDITKEVCDQPDWTVDTIKARHERLVKLAERTWTIA